MWPFRKKKQPYVVTGRADQEVQWSVQQDPNSWSVDPVLADMQRRLNEQIARIDALPLRRFHWTPVMNAYGQIIALAWKNDEQTAMRLLDEPAEGRA